MEVRVYLRALPLPLLSSPFLFLNHSSKHKSSILQLYEALNCCQFAHPNPEQTSVLTTTTPPPRHHFEDRLTTRLK